MRSPSPTGGDASIRAGSNVKAGIALSALGLLLLGLMVAFPARLRVPAPVGYFAAIALFLAGLLALANAYGGRAARAWLAVAVLSCLFVPAAWIAFGPGERKCAIRFDSLFGIAGDAVCRSAFGIGALLGLLLIAIALRQAWRAR